MSGLRFHPVPGRKVDITRPGEPAHVVADALCRAAIDAAGAFPRYLVLPAMLDAFIALAEEWRLPAADSEECLRLAADGVHEAYAKYGLARRERSAAAGDQRTPAFAKPASEGEGRDDG